MIHGDGDTIDGFADIVVVNYEVLDRHVGWLGDLGFRGMVVDEAHFIKNKTSQRSQHVLQLSERIRARIARPAADGAHRHPADQRHRGLPGDLAVPRLDRRQEAARRADGGARGDRPDAGRPRLLPAAARQCVIDMGIVRRRKVDVAADIPARRIADLPVELDDEAGRSIREAERELARRLVARYESALATRTLRRRRRGHRPRARTPGRHVGARGHDHRRRPSENVFTMMRRIGQAKAGLAADYAAQLARNVGKVVFFAKHIDVMDAAEETFAKRGIRYSSIRGDQTPKARQKNIDAFVNDPDVADRGLLADRGRRGPQPPGRLQRRARRALLDRRRADPGDRPGPPHRPGPSRSPRGASSPRRPSTPRSPS